MSEIRDKFVSLTIEVGREADRYQQDARSAAFDAMFSEDEAACKKARELAHKCNGIATGFQLAVKRLEEFRMANLEGKP